MPSTSLWPNNTRAAIALTFDNLGEAADLNRNLWPADKPIGTHYTVTRVIPQLLALLRKYDVSITYFIESWNLGVYGSFIADEISAKGGHEVGWHAWQHEAWGKLENGDAERGNFERSFGREGGIERFIANGGTGQGKVVRYKGFRPPGGLIHGERTLGLCKEFGMAYLSPAAEEGAVVKTGKKNEGGKEETLVVLPFKWATVDAYYYMETFSGLRKMKGEYGEEVQGSDVLVERYKKEVDRAIEKGSFLSLLFHPFLTEGEERLAAVEEMLKYLVEKRDKGDIWLAKMGDIAEWIEQNPNAVGLDPKWDTSSWR